MDVASVLRQVASEAPEVELAVLFGSHASGRATRGSDVDLGVRWVSEIDASAREQVLATFERAAGASIDVVDLDAAPPLLRMEIARDGAVLCEREAGAWSKFRARAMLDWWDFAPYARRMQRAAQARLGADARGPR